MSNFEKTAELLEKAHESLQGYKIAKMMNKDYPGIYPKEFLDTSRQKYAEDITNLNRCFFECLNVPV